VLCNKPYSGTDVIRDYGKEHLRTGDLIVYTSADSVFQIAAHEDLVPIDELYRYCDAARRLCAGKYGVGRVIARPFEGTPPFTRTPRRHDYSLKPPAKTMLDYISGAGKDVLAVGKINDIFAGSGITEMARTVNNADGIDKTLAWGKRAFHGLCFTNLVDFDALWGHRRNPVGYGEELERFDKKLGELLFRLREDDLLLITADHGNDPTYKGTDHTREKVPLLAYSPSMTGNGPLPECDSFGAVGATILDNFGLSKTKNMIGKSVFECLL